MNEVIIPSKSVPVSGKYDICVIGGSCTGAFAAIRAARLGAKVILIEKQNRFGGLAVSGLVSIWHSLKDTEFKETIIAGLTQEMVERLDRRNAVFHKPESPSSAFTLNTDELAIELDKMLLEAGVEVLLHTMFTAPYMHDRKLTGVVIDNKSGTQVVMADYFIDATGDADLCQRTGLSCRMPEHPQPPTACAKFSDWKFPEGFDLGKAIRKYGKEYGIPEGFIWGANVPGSDIFMLAGTRVFGHDCANGKDLTDAEIEGRRQIRAIHDLLIEKYGLDKITLQALPSMIGIRESRHINALHQVTGKELLYGVRFEDAIANGTYRVDIHQPDRPGIIFRYLNGRETYSCPGQPGVEGRWREPIENDPTFYQIPLRSLIPSGTNNIIVAGRMLDSDAEAFGGLRVMVNMNQTGEAAGVTAVLALDSSCNIPGVSTANVRETLKKGGSVII